MTSYLIMPCKFILTVNFQFNEQVLSNFRLIYSVTVFLCNMLNEYHCPVYLPRLSYTYYCCLFFSVDLCSIVIDYLDLLMSYKLPLLF